MRPRLIDFFQRIGLNVYVPDFKDVYIFMIIVALALSTVLAAKRGLPALKIYLVTVFLCIISLLGGFGYYYATRLNTASGLSLSGLFNSGGLGSFGAYLFGISGAICLLKTFKIDVLQALDVYTPVIALVHSLGRVACFLGGCCFGKAADLPWAVSYPPDSPAYMEQLARGKISGSDTYSLPVHPVQLYEALFGLISFVILLRLLNRRHTSGLLFFGYMTSYALFRFFAEFLRADYRLTVYFFSLPQVFSALFLISGLLGISMIGRTDNPRTLN